ncbi:2Fe-2S iron-sulfur cluster-binding protein [Sulfitobacter sp.]|uniref:2Fe-2S iron-sulfur cluster-binding protein n=1 Tax=Sulfitobacter sp. TaxID=1903071 RepID=UPI0030013C75
MTNPSFRRTAPIVLRSIRIWSGLFLLAFVTSHLINLSLGLITIETMDRARPYLSGFWSGPITGFLLSASLISHFVLGLWALYVRPTLRTNTQDIVQMLTGMIVVPLLATHAIGISMLADAGVDFGYADTIRLFWLQAPALGLMQVVMLSVVWVHGSAGLFTWLRSKENAGRLLNWLYLLAVIVPVFALLGYAEAGREMLIAGQAGANLASNPAIPEDVVVPFAQIKQVTRAIIYGSIILVVFTLVARFIRLILQKTQEVILVRNGGQEMISTSALSMLSGFQHNDQLHANLCAGRGRCGTCAVRVIRSEFPLPLASELEQRTLYKVGAPEGARLACQLTPAGGKVEVQAIYPADYTFEDARPTETATPSEVPA